MKRRKKSPELNRIRIIPMILITLILVFFLSGMLIGQKKMMGEYITNSKIKEAAIPAERLHNILKVLDITNQKEVTDCYNGFKALDNNFLGITVIKNEEVIYYIDNEMPENMFQKPIEPNNVKYVVNNNQVKLRTDDECELYLGIISNFNTEFSKRPLRENELSDIIKYSQMTEYAVMENTSRGYQDVWLYFYEDDDYVSYIGYKVSMTDNDYQMCYMFSIGFKTTILLVFIVLCIFIIRVFQSQYRIIKTYYTDKKTNGRNWEYFLEIVDKKIKTFDSNNSNGVIVSIEMENYNSYCSCYGEIEASSLLSDLYSSIKKNMPKKSYFARNEGGHFGLAVAYKELDELDDIIKKIIEAMKQVRPSASLEFKVGAYNINRNEKISVAEMFTRASIAAMPYGGILTFFNEKMRADIRWERTVEQDLDRAIKNKEFEIYLQPKYSVINEKPVAAEALIRWNHPKEGFLTPYRFIPIYEKSGLILKIDDYMVSSVAKIQSDAIKSGKKTIPISVNISRAHFVDDNLANHICSLVDEYSVPHELIELELTESAFFDDKDKIVSTTNKLKRLGFTVSLDDFGSGYSSLNSLSELPIDIVKLDAGFFRNVADEKKSNAIIKEIICLAKELDIKVVAEGIEVRSQVDYLAEFECDMIQGYYFAKPMPLQDFIAEVEKSID